MSGFSLTAVAKAFAVAVSLLGQFHQEVILPERYAAFNLSGLFSVLTAIMPWIQKGSFLAFVFGYMLVAVLMVNMLVLFTVAHLPGQRGVVLSTTSVRAGLVLLKLLVAGLAVWLRGLLKLLVRGWTELQALVLWLAAAELRTAC